jgi:hypothetical protein
LCLFAGEKGAACIAPGTPPALVATDPETWITTWKKCLFSFPVSLFLLYATASDFCTKLQAFLSANYICSIRTKCNR